MSEPQTTTWDFAIEDDPQWLISPKGAVRGPKSYREGGWWFLPANRPDTKEFDVGPFPTGAGAMREAERHE